MYASDEPRAVPGAVGEPGSGAEPIMESDAEQVRPGLQHLFGVRNGGLGDWGREGMAESQGVDESIGPSRYLQAYEADGLWGVLPTGVQRLDDVLGGGLGRGATVVGGDPGSGKTLFLEEVARAALSEGWSVFYAAYKEGATRTWERLMARASLDDGGLPLPLATISARALDRSSHERLQVLDAAFRSGTRERFVLVDHLPAGRDPLRALLDVVGWRRREAQQAGRPGPAVLIDDLQGLERLLAETGDRRFSGACADPPRAVERLEGLSDLVARLGSGLLRLGLPCVIAVGPCAGVSDDADRGTGSLEPGLQAGTFVRLSRGATDVGTEVPLEVAVEKNGRTGWVGRLPLALDRRVGRFEA